MSRPTPGSTTPTGSRSPRRPRAIPSSRLNTRRSSIGCADQEITRSFRPAQQQEPRACAGQEGRRIPGPGIPLGRGSHVRLACWAVDLLASRSDAPSRYRCREFDCSLAPGYAGIPAWIRVVDVGWLVLRSAFYGQHGGRRTRLRGLLSPAAARLKSTATFVWPVSENRPFGEQSSPAILSPRGWESSVPPDGRRISDFRSFQRRCESTLEMLPFGQLPRGFPLAPSRPVWASPQVDSTLGSTHFINAGPASPGPTSATRAGQAPRVPESPRRFAPQKTVSSSWPNPSVLKGAVMAED